MTIYDYNIKLESNEISRLAEIRGQVRANVLVMPGLHSANITAKILHQVGGGTVIGPLLVGLSKPAQVVQLGATVSELVTAAAVAAYEASDESG